VTPTHDVVLAGGDGLSVLSDELSLIDDTRPPLQLITIGFLENPKNYADPIYCDGPSLDEALGHRLRTARENEALVAGLPGVVAVAVTPRFAEAVLHCDQADAITFWARDPVGVLLHQVSECADQACYDDLVRQRVGRLRAVGLSPAWVAGSTGDDAVASTCSSPFWPRASPTSSSSPRASTRRSPSSTRSLSSPGPCAPATAPARRPWTSSTSSPATQTAAAR
jgi:hypothetical protein